MSKAALASFLSIALSLAIVLIPWPFSGGSDDTVVIQVEAEQYAYMPSVVTVSRGQEVVLELTSTDVVHGIFLDGYELEASSDPGQTTSISFKADRVGTFRFRCSVTCGPLHPFMLGELRVEPGVGAGRIVASSLIALFAGLALSFRNEAQ